MLTPRRWLTSRRGLVPGLLCPRRQARIERAELPALDTVRTALEEALGITFEGEKGEHFFRSTLVQTLFYGIFSAWVLWSQETSPRQRRRFDWRAAPGYCTSR